MRAKEKYRKKKGKGKRTGGINLLHEHVDDITCVTTSTMALPEDNKTTDTILIVEALENMKSAAESDTHTEVPIVIKSTTKIMSMWDDYILNKDFTHLWPANRGTFSMLRANPIGFEEYVRHLVLLYKRRL